MLLACFSTSSLSIYAMQNEYQTTKCIRFHHWRHLHFADCRYRRHVVTQYIWQNFPSYNPDSLSFSYFKSNKLREGTKRRKIEDRESNFIFADCIEYRHQHHISCATFMHTHLSSRVDRSEKKREREREKKLINFVCIMLNLRLIVDHYRVNAMTQWSPQSYSS